MATTLIIIGHDDQNQLQLDAAALSNHNGVLRATCSPGCQQTRPLTAGRSLMKQNFGLPVFAFTDDANLKPAELYVIQFSNTASTMAYIQGQSSFANTQDRTVLLVENTPEPGIAPPPYTLVIVGWDAANRLQLNTSGLQVVAECSNCQQTSVVTFGIGATGATNWSLSQSVAAKPAETYALGFESQQAAEAFVRSTLPADLSQFRTVLLVKSASAP